MADSNPPNIASKGSLQNVNLEISPDGLPQVDATRQPPPPKEPTTTATPAASPEPPDDKGQSTEHPESINEPEIDLTDFLSAKGHTSKEDLGAKPKKDESKVEDEPAPSSTPVTPKQSRKDKVKQDLDSRDYSELDPETEVPLFKQMGNEAFNLVAPAYKERKKLQEANKKLDEDIKARDTKIAELEKGIVKIPDSYYEHENGVLLTPEFNQAAVGLQTASNYLSHWQQQAKAISEGAKEIDFLYLDQSSGQLRIQKVPADARMETTVNNNIVHCQREVNRFDGKIQSLKETHADRHKQAIADMQAFEKKAFQWFDDPKNKDVAGALIKDTLETLHPVFRNNPLATTLVKSIIMNQQLTGLILKQQEETAKAKGAADTSQTQQRTQAAAARRQPTQADIHATNGGGGNDSDVSIDAFEKVKRS